MKFSTVNFDFNSFGYFDSSVSFPKKKVTADRAVQDYELEYFTDSGGIAFVDGREYAITKGLILIARPGTIRHSILHFKSYYFHLT